MQYCLLHISYSKKFSASPEAKSGNQEYSVIIGEVCDIKYNPL